MRPLLAAVLAALAFAAPLLAAAAPTPEDRLSGVFEAIEANRLDDALKRVDELIRDYPNFRLAHLVRGDLLLARSRPLLTFGNVVKSVPQEKIDGLREEALARLRAHRQRPGEDRLPRQVLQLHSGQKHVFLVDSRRSRLYVFANADGRPRLIADFYVTLGKNGIEKTREGDQKTPIGVYHVTANPGAVEIGQFPARGRIRSITRTPGTSASGATVTASGCTARPPIPIAARRAQATAASCSPTPIWKQSGARCRSA